ncbi:MAG: cysteine peptidase family C39 domain-containing protein, partial [Candidatus Omnitrophica bacterium]|nr:cysteine peptidase family C39 domain-containing protein [Candidatus Omnitrophota bacterium]
MNNMLRRLKIASPFIMLFLIAMTGFCPLQSVVYGDDRPQTLKAVNSGLLIISDVYDDFGITAKPEEIKRLSGLKRGQISFRGLKNAFEAKKLEVNGFKVTIKGLKSALARGKVITAINRGSNFVRILSVEDSYVTVFDPAIGNTFKYSMDIFKGDWDGKILIVNKKTPKKAAWTGRMKIMPIKPSAAGEEGMQALSGMEMQQERGGTLCQNTLLNSGLPWWLKLLLTADPVVIANGNLCSEETDFMVQTKGLIPLELKRTYNSQSPAILDQWKPEPGAGPWRIVNDEYCGHGDRSVSTFINGGYTLTLRMKTVVAGTNEPWMTARVNFNYLDANNTYYVLIDAKHKVELGRVIEGQYYVISHDTTLNPDDWNTVKIVSGLDYIKVYFNDQDRPEFNVPTAPQLRSGAVALEACFSHCHFDDVVVTPTGLDPIISDFNTPDRDEPFGMNWTYTYGMRIEQVPYGVMVVKDDDRRPVFIGPPVGGKYTSPRGIYDVLSVDEDSFTLTEKDGTKYHFNINGRLEYIEDRFDNRNTLHYEDIDGKERLKRVTDPSNRSLTFDYWSAGKIKEVTGPDGKKYQYFYLNGLLTEVKDPRGKSKYYGYDPIDQVRTKYT